MSMYLTRPELMDLTGYTSKSAVQRWLERHDWPYVIGGIDGWPRVLRQFHDQKLSGVAPSSSRKKAEPNWTRS